VSKLRPLAHLDIYVLAPDLEARGIIVPGVKAIDYAGLWNWWCSTKP
jgi:sulfur relay protein TusB/DsrH